MFTVNKLKISGFKSFAHPIELLIEDGVTGIIGPNGCGKSNIFEAIRWVMGESSSKSLRSSSMDDVIFNGTQSIPAKNFAEVSIELDQFDADGSQNLKIDDKKVIISRILERGVGSFFKINNKDVRAKDVSVLFYDSGSGPRSSSIITQGNIDQVINYKPIERKIILEDAAGISGLQARRRESELKLQSTDVNLEKVQINLDNLLDQKKSLSRQARQAERYESLSKAIKFYESLLIFSEWKDLKNNLDDYTKNIITLRQNLENFINESSLKKKKFQSLRTHSDKLQAVRNDLNKKLYETQSHKNNFSNQLDLIKNKKEEIRRFLDTIETDKNNELKNLKDLEIYIIECERKISNSLNNINLKKKLDSELSEEMRLRNEVKHIESIYVNEIQLTLGDEFKSDNLKEEKDSLKKEETINKKNIKSVSEEIKKLEKSLKNEELILANKNSKKSLFEKSIVTLKDSVRINRTTKDSNEESLKKIEENIEINLKRFTEIDTEIKTLNQLIGDANLSKESIVNLIKIKSGYESAVYAALMHELDATLNSKSSKKWISKKIDNLEAVKNPLSNYVEGPRELDLILSQIFLVEKKHNVLEEQKKLKVGQMLVNKNGSIWRWDGFISEENLQKKKIIDSQLKINELNETIKSLNTKLISLKKESKSIEIINKSLDKKMYGEEKDLELNYKNLDLIISQISIQKEKITLIKYNIQKNTEKNEELKKYEISIASKLQEIQEKELLLDQSFNGKSKTDKEGFEKKISELDNQIEQKRLEINKIKELIMKDELNKTYLKNDIEKSKTNVLSIKKRIETYNKRQKEYLQEEEKLTTLPNEIQKKIDNYQGYCNSYESELVKNNSSINQIAQDLKIVETGLLKVEQKRENQRNEITKLDGILENTKIKEKELRDLIYKRLNKQPEDLEKEKELIDKKLDTHEEIRNYLQKITFQREQMGPVNLRAKIEESEIQSMIDELELEKNDLVDALDKLRQAINKINLEGKNRLISAYEKVNKNFSDLFKKLFNGGEAKLELVKSDDPLQTGLEIFARPPGKKLSSINLLSGGEKTLTAIALIFSIFLINPSPICILDEVDAALDDVNIEKFCLILNELKNNTQTKFLLITHNKITMSSIDRVYGVTMPQKGISDIVSVDFEKVDFQEAI
ncbi:MAG: chromosome segregation protein SMC [Pelagibacteraceae bacterium TMED124]|nr:chromosome segregation protein SMC [Rickettsiales bacterium]RPG19498.1 MAG: chromosome segregation protein SMC [Pelagibacteraceae bacterium TMED124]